LALTNINQKGGRHAHIGVVKESGEENPLYKGNFPTSKNGEGWGRRWQSHNSFEKNRKTRKKKSMVNETEDRYIGGRKLATKERCREISGVLVESTTAKGEGRSLSADQSKDKRGSGVGGMEFTDAEEEAGHWFPGGRHAT